MNESLSVYLNLDMGNESRNEELIERIDELLLTAGLKYSGIRNIYVPVDRQTRDQAVFRAEKLLRTTDWLKDILACTLIGTWTNACPLEKIQTDAMSEPSPEKLRYYEQYFEKTHELPHAIVVDENRQRRDGYVSYLLAKKCGVSAEVCEMVSGQPLRKIVKGRHVKFSDGKWRRTNDKQYTWIYTLKAPVVPGDILLVDTNVGTAFISVDRIDYIAGYEFCSMHKTVRRHMNAHMEEGEGTGHEK